MGAEQVRKDETDPDLDQAIADMEGDRPIYSQIRQVTGQAIQRTGEAIGEVGDAIADAGQSIVDRASGGERTPPPDAA